MSVDRLLYHGLSGQRCKEDNRKQTTRNNLVSYLEKRVSWIQEISAMVCAVEMTPVT